MRRIFLTIAFILAAAPLHAGSITYADKVEGGTFTHGDANEIKTVVNGKVDAGAASVSFGTVTATGAGGLVSGVANTQQGALTLYSNADIYPLGFLPAPIPTAAVTLKFPPAMPTVDNSLLNFDINGTGGWTAPTAANFSIVDSGGNFTATDIEAALAELADELDGLPTLTWGTGLTDTSNTISVTYPVTAEAYGSGWDNDGNGATKNDVYDAGFEQKASNETITGTRTFQAATTVGDGGDDIDIVYDSTPGADDSWSGAQITVTAGENLAQWDIIYAKNASGTLKWYKYDANGTDKLLAPRAVALAAITADATGLAGIGDGIARNDGWSMTTNQDEGKDVWASATAGGLTLTKLSTSGDEVARLGYVLEENVIQFSLGNVTLVEVP